MVVALTAFVAALAAGLVHVVAGPDHLAAVGPFSIEGKRGAWRIGARWGFGHAAGTLVVGAFALAARELVPLDLVSSIGERLVGVVLVAIGVVAVVSILRTRVHEHEHAHDGVRHVHMHAHVGGRVVHAHAGHAHRHSAFSIGTLHGVAGGSHLFGVLPALGLGSTAAAVSYVSGFALGSLLAMTAFTAGLGAIAARLSPSARLFDGLRWTTAIGAMSVGLLWIAIPP
jgi:hypothetical protein